MNLDRVSNSSHLSPPSASFQKAQQQFRLMKLVHSCVLGYSCAEAFKVDTKTCELSRSILEMLPSDVFRYLEAILWCPVTSPEHYFIYIL